MVSSGGGLLFRRAIVKINEESVKLEGDRSLAPVIGVTATLKQDVDGVAQRPLGRFVRADFDYVEGVVEAGGVPVVLPPVVEPGAAEALLGGMDGLLLSGGATWIPFITARSLSPNSASRSRSGTPSR